MEAERSNTSSVKRKPLSDRTNIIPSTTIRNFTSPPFFTKSSNPNSVPVQIPKPFNPSSKPYKRITNSSKSNSSVGSTNSSSTKNDRNSTRAPQIHPSTPTTKPFLHSESTNPGNENVETFEPLTVYRRKPTEDKTGKKGNKVDLPSSYSNHEKTTDKRSVPVEKTKDKGKAIAMPHNLPNAGRSKDKQKATSLPLDVSALLRTKDKGKEIDVPFTIKRNYNAKKVDIPHHQPTPEKGNDRGRKFSASFSSSALTRTRNSENECNDEAESNGLLKFQTDPHLKHKKKRRIVNDPTFELSKEFLEKQKAYFKEIDEFELPVEEASDEE